MGFSSVNISIVVVLRCAQDDREILRCAQDDRAVLPAALWPTRAPARLRVMRIKADKSAMCTINRLPVPQTGSLRFPQE